MATRIGIVPGKQEPPKVEEKIPEPEPEIEADEGDVEESEPEKKSYKK